MAEPDIDMEVNREFDAIIVGGGLVGAACALALSRQNLKIAVVERRAADALLDGELDSRIYAISPGNAAWLATLGVWQAMDAKRVCAIDGMQIHGDDSHAQLEFDAYEADVSSLGFIVENKLLQHALWQSLQASDVTIILGQSSVAASWQNAQPELTLDDGRSYSASLLIAADGANSWLRTQAKIDVKVHDYRQMGVVANFEAELPHAHIARQWFGRNGVLAWLPLPEKRISMVWSTSVEHAQHLLALDATALADTVAAAGNHELGMLRLITMAQAFSLNLQTAQTLVKPGLVLLGDAAHVIHPLAGQGVNLGFRDVITLVETLAQRNPLQRPGDVMLLRRYERARKTDIMAMRVLTDGLYQLFASEQPVIRQLRNWGLGLTNYRPLVKKRLIKQAML